jgi:hypothetical protein
MNTNTSGVYRWVVLGMRCEQHYIVSRSFGCGRFGSVRFGSVQQLNFICRRRRQIGYFCSSLGYLSALSLRSLSLSALSVALDLDEAIVFSRVGFMNLDVDAYNRRGCFLRFEPWSHAVTGTTRRFLAESIQ